MIDNADKLNPRQLLVNLNRAIISGDKDAALSALAKAALAGVEELAPDHIREARAAYEAMPPRPELNAEVVKVF